MSKILEDCYQYNYNQNRDYNYIYLENIIYRTFIIAIIIKFIIKTVLKVLNLISVYFDKVKTNIIIYFNKLKTINLDYVILIILGFMLIWF